MCKWNTGAFLITVGLIVIGYQIKKGIDNLVEKDRIVTVKGLAEMEIPANKVTWPLMYKEVGNDLTVLYNKIRQTNEAIVKFLKEKGITENEISINAPEIIDM